MVCLFSDKMSYHYFTKCKFLAMWNETGKKKKAVCHLEDKKQT